MKDINNVYKELLEIAKLPNEESRLHWLKLFWRDHIQELNIDYTVDKECLLDIKDSLRQKEFIEYGIKNATHEMVETIIEKKHTYVEKINSMFAPQEIYRVRMYLFKI